MERLRAWLRRYWLILLVIVAVLVFVLLNRNQLASILTTLVRGNLVWIGAAILLQAAFYLVYAELYHLGFGTVEVASRTVELIPVLFAARVVQVVIPTGGASALAVFVADAVRRKQSGTRAAEGVLLVLLATLIVLVPFLALGLAYLVIATGMLEVYQQVGAVALLIYTGVLGAIVLLGRYIPRPLGLLFGVIQGIVNWVARRLRRQPLPEDWGSRQASAYIAASEGITAHPRQLRTVLLVALALQSIDIASLYAVALAFHALPSVGAVIAAYTLNVAYAVATPIPLGLGISAGIITLVLTGTGTVPGAAGATAIVYRGLNAWLPILLGIVFLGRVQGLRGGGGS